jgi:hypothetical protein
VGLNAGVSEGRKIGDNTADRADLLPAQDLASRVDVVDMASQITKNREREDPYF